MKILFCSPYKQSREYVQGGVGIWGANILYYYNSIKKTDVELVPISFDRKTYSENHSTRIGAFANGVKELWHPVIKVIRMIQKKDFDAVHICTNTGRSLIKDLVILYFAHKYGVRGYVHFHCGTIPIVLKQGGFYRKLLLKVFSNATKGITIDRSSYESLIEYGVNNVVNLPNPLSFSIMEQVTAKKNKICKVPGRIAFVGHVLRNKGIFELIESCSRLGKPDLHIIGKVMPKDKVYINDLLSKYGTDDSWITWVGEIPHEQVIDELLATEIFALPTYFEGFPNVILEAMASRCAIISTTVGAIPEMLDIDGNPCGICVEPRNANAFYESLSRVYSDKKLLNCLAEKAEKRVFEKYCIDKVWKQMVDIWRG